MLWPLTYSKAKRNTYLLQPVEKNAFLPQEDSSTSQFYNISWRVENQEPGLLSIALCLRIFPCTRKKGRDWNAKHGDGVATFLSLQERNMQFSNPILRLLTRFHLEPQRFSCSPIIASWSLHWTTGGLLMKYHVLRKKSYFLARSSKHDAIRRSKYSSKKHSSKILWGTGTKLSRYLNAHQIC